MSAVRHKAAEDVAPCSTFGMASSVSRFAQNSRYLETRRTVVSSRRRRLPVCLRTSNRPCLLSSLHIALACGRDHLSPSPLRRGDRPMESLLDENACIRVIFPLNRLLTFTSCRRPHAFIVDDSGITANALNNERDRFIAPREQEQSKNGGNYRDWKVRRVAGSADCRAAEHTGSPAVPASTSDGCKHTKFATVCFQGFEDDGSGTTQSRPLRRRGNARRHTSRAVAALFRYSHRQAVRRGSKSHSAVVVKAVRGQELSTARDAGRVPNRCRRLAELAPFGLNQHR